MNFLYQFPDPVTIPILAAGVAIISIIVIVVLNRLVPESDKETTDLVLRAMTSTSAILTFVLGFSIVQAKIEVNKVLETVNAEARALGITDRMMLRFDATATAPAREALARYTLSVIRDEWPELLERSRSLETGARIRRLTRMIDELQPAAGRQQTIFNELIRSAETLEQRRDDRIFHAEHTRLPVSFWMVIGILLGSTMIMGGFFRLRPVSLLMLTAQAAMFGVLAAFLFMLDEPFIGYSGVKVEPFKRTLATLSSVSALPADELRSIGVTPRPLVEARPLR
ncbi:MAG TPA: DUF4239 domain-containing protein [Pseudolabrys sp.]|nr:DUF4239 domain-containing protein [Pseudolabrys sp.]